MNLYTMKLKRTTLFASATIAVGIITPVANADSKVKLKHNDIYSVKITKIKHVNGAWEISGTTKAPNDTKIMAYNPKNASKKNLSTSTFSSLSWSTVSKHKFKVDINALDVSNNNIVHPGRKYKVAIMGITNYDQDPLYSVIPNKILKAYHKRFNYQVLPMPSGFAHKVNSIKKSNDEYQSSRELNSSSFSEPVAQSSSTEISSASSDAASTSNVKNSKLNKFTNRISNGGGDYDMRAKTKVDGNNLTVYKINGYRMYENSKGYYAYILQQAQKLDIQDYFDSITLDSEFDKYQFTSDALRQMDANSVVNANDDLDFNNNWDTNIEPLGSHIKKY